MLSAVALAQSVSIVAVVNEEVITSYDVEQAEEGDYTRYELSTASLGISQPSKKTGRDLLDDLIRNNLLDQEIRRLGIEVEPRDIDQELKLRLEQLNMKESEFTKELAKQHLTMEQYRRGVEDQLKLIRFISRRIRPRIMIDEKSIAEYHAKNANDFVKPDRVHLQRIEFVSPEGRKRADSILKDLRKNPNGTAAGKYPGVQIQDIGFINGNDMNPAFRYEVGNLEVGGVTGIFRSSSQWIAFQLLERQKGEPYTLEEITKDVRGELLEKRVEQELRQYVDQLKDQAHIEIKKWQ